MFGSRRWDGKPETPADKRFFTLRESGYRGPINENGEKVTSGPAAEVLRDLANQRGEDTSWWTGS